MKFLTLTQPWASLVACGAKRIETRSWKTAYRGLIGIHAATKFEMEVRELCHQEPIHSALFRWGTSQPGSLPRGSVLAVARIADCVPIGTFRPGQEERALGDYTPGRYAWLLADIRRLPAPIPWRGRQGLWADSDLESKVQVALKEQP